MSIDIISYIAQNIVTIVEEFGYIGIFIGMLLESTFVPLPSEIIMIPAGYLASKGEMHIIPIVICGVLGSGAGSWICYSIARHFGRSVLVKYGKYILISSRNLEKIEGFFIKHGNVSVFTGRLIFGVRHFISVPAGIAKLHVGKFLLFTMLGSAIWVIILVSLGYYIGEEIDRLHIIMPFVKYGVLTIVSTIALIIVIKNKIQNIRQNRKNV